MNLAHALELERDHALDRGSADALLDDSLLAEAESSESVSESLTEEYDWKALESEANFDRVLFDGAEFGFAADTLSDEEHDFLGIPGILEPDQVRDVLQARQARQSRRSAAREAALPPEQRTPPPLYRTLKDQRKVLSGLVSVRAKLTGQPHAIIHSELRRVCGGPAVPQATVAQLQARIDYLRKQR